MMSNVKFLYVRNEWKNRDITIVSNLFDEGDKTFVKFAWAFRNNHDKFKKAEGRKIALERLESNDSNYSDVFEIEKDKIKFFNIATDILSIISQKENTPRKYIDDICEDLHYYIHCSNGGHTKEYWNSAFELE
jgi:hypothetical protein